MNDGSRGGEREDGGPQTLPSWLRAIRRTVRRGDRTPRRRAGTPRGHAATADDESGVCRAWGVDLDCDGLHLVGVSAVRGAQATFSDIRIDAVQHVAWPSGVVHGADIVAPEEVGAALRAALAATAAGASDRPQGDGAAAGPLSVALCPSVVLSRDIPWTSLLPGHTVSFPDAGAVSDALAPWIRWHAQRLSGLDDVDLLVDWQRSPHDRTMVRLTAAQAHYLRIRDVVAAQAGVRVTGLIDAAQSALRACRFVAARCVQRGNPAARASGVEAGALVEGVSPAGTACDDAAASLRLACVWRSKTAAAAWTFDAYRTDEVALPCALPDVEAASPEAWCAALHAVLRERQHRPALLIVCGHEPALATLGCMAAPSSPGDYPVIRFDASTCHLHETVPPAAAARDCAVALGAALHGLADDGAGQT